MAIVVVMAIASCGGDDVEPTAVARLPVADTPASTSPVELQIALASTDISVGRNRIAFGLIDRQTGAVRDALVVVSTFFLTDDGPQGPKETVDAVFRKWPVGQSGVFTVEVNFDRPGTWGLGVGVTGADGRPGTGSAGLDVREIGATPPLDSPAPRSNSKTIADVEDFDQITTDVDPDPDLYALTIAEAIDSGLPSLVVFATPAYCTTSTCGPQLGVVKDIKKTYGDSANFVHVEVWDNPHEIDGDLSRGKLSPTLAEWGLVTEPWTFVLDRNGLVAAKFEGFATTEELEEAMVAVLR
ncbi:MAG: thioredoxin family protein [Chloroflexi bacterium]|nr:thioredoxin family protein [Chloroflexota bacterium]